MTLVLGHTDAIDLQWSRILKCKILPPPSVVRKSVKESEVPYS